MQIISDKAVEILKGNHRVLGKLVIAFNKHFRTIEYWIEKRDVRLTTPTAVRIISEETGLSKEDILIENEIA